MPQASVLAGQLQVPPLQTVPPEQTTPQPPQLLLSVSGSTQEPAQFVSFAAHVALQED
jgi:hypothetical protein